MLIVFVLSSADPVFEYPIVDRAIVNLLKIIEVPQRLVEWFLDDNHFTTSFGDSCVAGISFLDSCSKGQLRLLDSKRIHLDLLLHRIDFLFGLLKLRALFFHSL